VFGRSPILPGPCGGVPVSFCISDGAFILRIGHRKTA